MFGHQDDDDKQQPQANGDTPPAPADQTQAAGAHEADQPPESTAEPADEAPAAPVIQPEPATPSDTVASDDSQDQAWQHPGTPLNDDQPPISDVISPAGGFPKRPSYQYPKGSPEISATDTPPTADDPANRDLVDVKEHALEELAPLLDKLDLPPEEKFRAIMMIIQSNDDKSLVKLAYEAAHAIKDDEIRARALYTIVNEVDYFTHQSSDSD
jgi:hypothetical protein